MKAILRLAAALAVVATALAPTQAQAAPAAEMPPLTVIFMGGPPSVEHRTAFMAALSDCGVQRMCTWWNANYVQPMYYYTLEAVPIGPGCRNVGPPWDDQISSVYNRFGFEISLDVLSNCQVTPFIYGLNANTAVSWAGSYWNDKISSFNRCGFVNC